MAKQSEKVWEHRSSRKGRLQCGTKPTGACRCPVASKERRKKSCCHQPCLYGKVSTSLPILKPQLLLQEQSKLTLFALQRLAGRQFLSNATSMSLEQLLGLASLPIRGYKSHICICHNLKGEALVISELCWWRVPSRSMHTPVSLHTPNVLFSFWDAVIHPKP